MGTSQSKPDSKSGSSLIPPWAEQDPTLLNQVMSPQVLQTALPRRYGSFRSALGRFASSGSTGTCKSALGHWVKTSRGGSTTGTQRLARASKSGGAALAGFARAVGNQPPLVGTFDIRQLAGKSVDFAISKIVDEFCPPGILDEEIVRLAIGEALASSLSGLDIFDPESLNTYTIRVAIVAFVAELVLISVLGDAGQALAKAANPLIAVQRESAIRSLIKQATNTVGIQILGEASNVLTPSDMEALISRLLTEVQAEMETW